VRTPNERIVPTRATRDLGLDFRSIRWPRKRSFLETKIGEKNNGHSPVFGQVPPLLARPSVFEKTLCSILRIESAIDPISVDRAAEGFHRGS
jgi:hypothetical protein